MNYQDDQDAYDFMMSEEEYYSDIEKNFLIDDDIQIGYKLDKKHNEVIISKTQEDQTDFIIFSLDEFKLLIHGMKLAN